MTRSCFRACALAASWALAGLAPGPGCAAAKTKGQGENADVGPGAAVTPARPDLRLTAAAPSQVTPPGAGLGVMRGAPELLELSILSIRNPASQSFSIKATVLAPELAGAGVIDIGRFTPYPPDATGTYLAAVPAALRSLVVAQARTARVRLTLVATSPDRPLAEPLEVVVSPPVWRASR
jgi:hypothetical protein